MPRQRKTNRHAILPRISSLNYSLVCTMIDAQPTNENPELEAERNAILEYDGNCVYCRICPAVTTDHFIPHIRDKRASGYGDDTANKVPCCSKCNCSKGNKLLSQWKPALMNEERWKKFADFHSKHAIMNQKIVDGYAKFQPELENYLRDLNTRILLGMQFA